MLLEVIQILFAFVEELRENVTAGYSIEVFAP